MSGIRAKNTKPELQIRRAMHAQGFRFRLHSAVVPGRPDMVFPKYHAAAFVHGCFWHGHRCPLFKLPDTRRQFWSEKIERNRQRDRIVQKQLSEAGWRVAIMWECALRGPGRLGIQDAAKQIAMWLPALDNDHLELRAAKRGAA